MFPHFKPRSPPHFNNLRYCASGRSKIIVDKQCLVCRAATHIIECVKQKKLSDEVIAILMPVVCKQHFSDVNSLKVHTDITYCSHALLPESSRSPHLLTETRLKGMDVGQGKKGCPLQVTKRF